MDLDSFFLHSKALVATGSAPTRDGQKDSEKEVKSAQNRPQLILGDIWARGGHQSQAHKRFSQTQ